MAQGLSTQVWVTTGLWTSFILGSTGHRGSRDSVGDTGLDSVFGPSSRRRLYRRSYPVDVGGRAGGGHR